MTKINPTIFKSYDIRGIYPEELNEEAAYNIGRAFIRHSGAKNVVIGHDARISSPALFKALARGVWAEGGNIYDIGRGPTECVYFAVGARDFDGGVMITASHNPKEYNGFKMLVRRSPDGEGGMEKDSIEIIRGKDLLDVVLSEDPIKSAPQSGAVPRQAGQFNGASIWQDYTNHIFSFIDLSEIVPLKIVVDASNGVAGEVISKIKNKLPVEIISLNFEPDGNFPNHSPNPLEEGSSDRISETIKSQKADFGIMFDGDADRIFLLDENGKLIRADVTLLLLAKYFLQKNPGSAIVYNTICSKAVPEFIKKWGGNPIRTQVGFINVRDGLLRNNGSMGGELSGHYCFKDNFYLDSGMITFLILLQIISEDGRKVSEIIKELSPYAKSPELNFKIEDKNAILEKIKQKYSDGEQDYLDGVTVEYRDWWFNVRASNTEPLLRLTIEADTQDILETKQKELSDFIIKN